MLKSTKGKFFSVTFTKKDGSTRNMTARLGVKKGIKGVGMKFNPAEKDLMVVWATDRKSYRMINLKTISSIKVNGNTHLIPQKCNCFALLSELFFQLKVKTGGSDD